MGIVRDNAMDQELRGRLEAVREAMAEAGMDVLITGSSAQLEHRGILRYLADYTLPVFEEYLVIPLNGPVTFFAHDPCGAAHVADSGTLDDIRIIPGHEYNSDPGKCVAEMVKGLGPRTIAVACLAGISAKFFNSLSRHLGTAAFTDFTDRLNAIRMVKSPLEVALSEAAVRLNEDTFRFYLQQVKPGNRELDAVTDASTFALRNGGEDVYWMASSGPVPHLAYLATARRRNYVWRQGDYHYAVLEHSATGGHWGETTHLVCLGEPKPEYAKAFQAVGEAQRAAASMITPGGTVGALADASEAALAGLGYAAARTPGSAPVAIGHSQGADVWEFPRIVSGDATMIRPNMRFNIHPAVTLPDGAVITSCDCWISTDTGARRLSTLPYEIIAVP